MTREIDEDEVFGPMSRKYDSACRELVRGCDSSMRDYQGYQVVLIRFGYLLVISAVSSVCGQARKV